MVTTTADVSGSLFLYLFCAAATMAADVQAEIQPVTIATAAASAENKIRARPLLRSCFYFNIPLDLSLSQSAKRAFALWLILFFSSKESSEKVLPREGT